jgi:hypothetical protein
MSSYNDHWKLHRKTITKVVSSNVSVARFDRVQEEEAAHFLMNVLAAPERLFDHIRTEAGAVILKITYGYTARNRGRDPLVELAGKAVWTFAEATVPGKWAVDVFPFCECGELLIVSASIIASPCGGDVALTTCSGVASTEPLQLENNGLTAGSEIPS